jgi:hypothetical protein
MIYCMIFSNFLIFNFDIDVATFLKYVRAKPQPKLVKINKKNNINLIKEINKYCYILVLLTKFHKYNRIEPTKLDFFKWLIINSC